MFPIRKRGSDNSEKKNVAPMLRAASFLPETFNEADNTIELVAATENEALMSNWDGLIREVLDMEDSSVRLNRLNSGANVLDNHDTQGSVRSVIVGVVEKAWLKDRKLFIKMRFSKRADVKPLIDDVKDGITRNISVRYRVYKYMIIDEPNSIPLYRAMDWEPFEVSFVPVPADFMAGIRNDNSSSLKNEVEVVRNNNSRVDNTRSEGNSQTSQTEIKTDLHTSTAPASATTEKETTGSNQITEDVRKSATKEERQRSTDILTACRAANLSVEFAEKLISDDKVDINKARGLIIDELAKGQSNAVTRGSSMIIVKDDEQERDRAAIEVALLNRSDPGSFKLGDEKVPASVIAHQKFRGISLLGVIHALMEQRGMKVSPFDKQELYARAMSTSDFPNLLSNVANKFLRKEYEQTPQTFKALAAQRNLPDFKETAGIQFGGAIKFEEVKEGGEFKFGSLTETKDGWRLSTYGKILRMTRQMIINDDLSAFIRIARLIAIGAANNESNLFWNLITGNTKMGDSTALFHASHGNLAGAGGALDPATMNAARTAMRRQKGLTSDELIEVTPRFIVVAPEQEMAADQLLTNITPNSSGQVNPFTAAGLLKIVESRLPAGPWYVFSDTMLESFTYGYLEGNEGLFTETRYGFEVDGVEIKARQDFGTKAWDWRGTFKNPGA